MQFDGFDTQGEESERMIDVKKGVEMAHAREKLGACLRHEAMGLQYSGELVERLVA